MSQFFGTESRTNKLEGVKSSPTTKRRKVTLTSSQLLELELELQKNKYRSRKLRLEMARALNLNVFQRRNWFRNKGMKYVKEQKATALLSSTSPASPTHHRNATTTGVRARCNDLKSNPRMDSKNIYASSPSRDCSTSHALAEDNYDMEIHQDDALPLTVKSLNYGTPGAHSIKSPTTGLKARCIDLKCNSRTNSQNIPSPSTQRVSFPTYASTEDNSVMEIHQDETLPFTVDSMNYDTPGEYLINSPTHHPYAITTGLGSMRDGVRLMSGVCSQYITFSSPSNVSSPLYALTEENYDMEVQQDSCLPLTVNSINYGIPGNHLINSITHHPNAITTSPKAMCDVLRHNPGTTLSPSILFPSTFATTEDNYVMDID